MGLEEAAVRDVGVKLARVGRAAPGLVAIATKAHERADPRAALVAHDVVGVIGVERAALGIDEAGQAKARAEVDQHRLEAAHVAVGFGHRPADRIARRPRLGDRAVEQADTVIPLHIGGVGQDQVA